MQGKSLPSARSGELSRVDWPYGTGMDIFIWALTDVERTRAAKALRVICLEYIADRGDCRYF